MEKITSMATVNEIVEDVMWDIHIMQSARNIIEHSLSAEDVSFENVNDLSGQMFAFGCDIIEATMHSLATRGLEPLTSDDLGDLVIADEVNKFLESFE